MWPSHSPRKADVRKRQCNKEVTRVSVTPKPAEMVKSEAERPLGLLASPHRPQGAHVELDSSHSVILTGPPPGFPRTDTAEKKPNAAFSVMKHKPPEPLLGNCSPQTPACDTERNPDTRDRAFFSMQKVGMAFRIMTSAFKLSHRGCPL